MKLSVTRVMGGVFMWPGSPKHLAWVHSNPKGGKSRGEESPATPSSGARTEKVLRPWPGPFASDTKASKEECPLH